MNTEKDILVISQDTLDKIAPLPKVTSVYGSEKDTRKTEMKLYGVTNIKKEQKRTTDGCFDGCCCNVNR